MKSGMLAVSLLLPPEKRGELDAMASRQTAKGAASSRRSSSKTGVIATLELPLPTIRILPPAVTPLLVWPDLL
jgi:hypothetical protein